MQSEGYGLQPVHEIAKSEWALAPEETLDHKSVWDLVLPKNMPQKTDTTLPIINSHFCTIEPCRQFRGPGTGTELASTFMRGFCE
jgi:hypothetical protein